MAAKIKPVIAQLATWLTALESSGSPVFSEVFKYFVTPKDVNNLNIDGAACIDVDSFSTEKELNGYVTSHEVKMSIYGYYKDPDNDVLYEAVLDAISAITEMLADRYEQFDDETIHCTHDAAEFQDIFKFKDYEVPIPPGFAGFRLELTVNIESSTI